MPLSEVVAAVLRAHQYRSSEETWKFLTKDATACKTTIHTSGFEHPSTGQRGPVIRQMYLVQFEIARTG